MIKVRKQNAIKLEVLKANPRDVADILPHLKDESITINEDGTVTGLKEQLESLKENKGYLFKETEPTGTGGSLGNGGKGGTGKTITKEEFDKMSYSEKVELYNKDQDLYRELTK